MQVNFQVAFLPPVQTSGQSYPYDCSDHSSVSVSSQEGYISGGIQDPASRSLSHLVAGSRRCPWSIQAGPGQRIRVSLLDFSRFRDPESRQITSCHIYAYVTETGGAPGGRRQQQEQTICGAQGEERERVVFESQGDTLYLETMLETNSKAAVQAPHFLLHYQGIVTVTLVGGYSKVVFTDAR